MPSSNIEQNWKRQNRDKQPELRKGYADGGDILGWGRVRLWVQNLWGALS